VRALLCILLAMLCFSFSPASQAQPNTATETVEIPAEFKGFFDDYSALAKKYPAAASRFGVFDRKNPTSARAEDSNPILRSSFCTGSNQCCTKIIDEGTRRCVECSFCPK
jgi:hypothetical protein